MKGKKYPLGILLQAAALAALLFLCKRAGILQEADFKSRLNLSAAALLKVLTMAAGILLLARLLRALLKALRLKSHRGMTMITLASSLIQYTAALVTLCWGLSILGVNVSAIVASVGVLALISEAPRYLGVQSLDSSSVVLRFTAAVSEENIYAAQRKLNRELLLGLRRLGVECPFPQLDVHSK